jgi:RNA polymerase sigma-70 factor (ECF subfamily)
MTDLALLRQIADSQPELVDERFLAIRTRLLADFQAAPAATPRRHHPQRRPSRASITVLVATCVAVLAVLLVTVFGLGGATRPQSAVAETLEHAATATIGVHDPVVHTGKYLHVQTTYNSSVVDIRESGGDLAWLIHGVNDEWVPGDQNANWVQRRGVGLPFKFFSPAAKHEALTDGRPIDDKPVTLEGKNGIFAPTAENSLPPWTPATLNALPRDPTRLLTVLAKREGVSATDHALMFETLTEILTTGFAPAQVRATIYRAIVTIPGVAITDRTANLVGKTGVAIGRTDPSTGVRLDLIIDADDGVVIGTRSVLTKAYHGMPAGTVQSFTAVRTSVVDSAPATR